MNRLIWIIIAAAMLHACNPQAEYIIRGELPDANGWKVVLARITAGSDDPVRIDSCVVKRGKFRLKGTVSYPEYCVLYVGDHGPLRLIVENTEIDIDVNLKNIQDSKVTGSKETDLFVEFRNKMVEFEESAQQQRIDYMKQLVAEYPNSIFTALMIDNILGYYIEPEELESYAEGFDEVNSQSPWVQSIWEKAASAMRLAIGKPFVDIKMPTPDGTEIALSDYAGKDKYVLIDFWASWCGPCRRANPHVVKLYKKYKDKGFEIVGVSFDRAKTEWVNAIEADALTWPQMSDLKYWQSEGAKLYSVNSIPYTVLLDKDGTILDKGLQPDELEKKLAELIE